MDGCRLNKAASVGANNSPQPLPIVIPAKAGTQEPHGPWKANGADSTLRRNDKSTGFSVLESHPTRP